MTDGKRPAARPLVLFPDLVVFLLLIFLPFYFNMGLCFFCEMGEFILTYRKGVGNFYFLY